MTKKEYNDYLRENFVCRRKDDPLENYDYKQLFEFFQSFNIKSFYKYMSLDSDYTLNNIEKDVFHFSLIKDLNDIFEFSYNILDVAIEESKRKELLSHIIFVDPPEQKDLDEFLDVNNSLAKVFSKIIEYTFIYSLTTSYNNHLMWGHYANSYNGICVEYDSIELFIKYHMFLAPVEYSENVAKESYYNSSNDKIRYLQKCCSTKEKCWEYEDEWRIIKIDLVNRPSIMNDHIVPKSVTYGYNTKEKDIEKLCEICKQKHIPLYRLAKINDGTFSTKRILC